LYQDKHTPNRQFRKNLASLTAYKVNGMVPQLDFLKKI
jgi:hypothetical protein